MEEKKILLEHFSMSGDAFEMNRAHQGTNNIQKLDDPARTGLIWVQHTSA